MLYAMQPATFPSHNIHTASPKLRVNVHSGLFLKDNAAPRPAYVTRWRLVAGAVVLISALLPILLTGKVWTIVYPALLSVLLALASTVPSVFEFLSQVVGVKDMRAVADDRLSALHTLLEMPEVQHSSPVHDEAKPSSQAMTTVVDTEGEESPAARERNMSFRITAHHTRSNSKTNQLRFLAFVVAYILVTVLLLWTALKHPGRSQFVVNKPTDDPSDKFWSITTSTLVAVGHFIVAVLLHALLHTFAPEPPRPGFAGPLVESDLNEARLKASDPAAYQLVQASTAACHGVPEHLWENKWYVVVGALVMATVEASTVRLSTLGPTFLDDMPAYIHIHYVLSGFVAVICTFTSMDSCHVIMSHFVKGLRSVAAFSVEGTARTSRPKHVFEEAIQNMDANPSLMLSWWNARKHVLHHRLPLLYLVSSTNILVMFLLTLAMAIIVALRMFLVKGHAALEEPGTLLCLTWSLVIGAFTVSVLILASRVFQQQTLQRDMLIRAKEQLLLQHSAALAASNPTRGPTPPFSQALPHGRAVPNLGDISSFGYIVTLLEIMAPYDEAHAPHIGGVNITPNLVQTAIVSVVGPTLASLGKLVYDGLA